METIDVVAAIIRHDGKIFATQRGYGDFAGGWEFPGGKIEAGETPEAALTREIREELAARIAVDSHFMTVEYDYPAFHLSMRCYLCHVVEGDLTLLEHASARWLDASTIDEVAWLPATAPSSRESNPNYSAIDRDGSTHAASSARRHARFDRHGFRMRRHEIHEPGLMFGEYVRRYVG